MPPHTLPSARSRLATGVLVASALAAGCAGSRPPDPATAPVLPRETLFNGTDLSGWNGDPRFWRVEDGAIVGQTTPDNPVHTNTFLIWEGGEVSDFTLTFDFRLTGGNSGVQYRSEVVEGWVLRGYQGDLDARNRHTGMLHEERGRGIIARRGQRMVVEPDGTPVVVGSVGDPDELAAGIDLSNWNTYEVRAAGNRLVHRVNGRVTVDVVDDHAGARASSGLLGFQIHTGSPMKIELSNIVLDRSLPGAASL